MEADISTWRKPGHFYFALTRTDEARRGRRGLLVRFVPTLYHEPSQVGTVRARREVHLAAQRFNAMADNRNPSQLSLDGLLINGLEVRVLPGSPLISGVQPGNIGNRLYRLHR